MKGNLAYHILALVVVAIWGVTFISTKVLIYSGLSPAHIFAIRFLISYAGIWIMCAAEGVPFVKLFCPRFKDEFIFIILGITGGSIYFLSENSALVHTQACNVSFIVCSAPLLTSLLTLAVRKFFHGTLVDGLERVDLAWPLVLGTVLALSGMAAVIFDGNAVQFSALGDILAFCAALLWAVYSIFMSQMTVRYGPLFATRKVFFYGLVTIIPFLGGGLPSREVFSRPEVWGNLLFLSIVASLVCYTLWNKVMARIGNVTSTNYIYLNPFFTLVAAVIFLGESMSLQSALGCAAIVMGVVIGGYHRS